MAKGEYRLTDQQAYFAELVALGYNLSAAYRRAYPVSQDTKGATIWPNASKLAKNAKVAARVNELKEESRRRAAITLADHMMRLDEIGRRAEMEGDLSVAATCEIARGKAAGFYVTRVEGGKPGEFDAMDEAAARKRIAERCARLGVQVPPYVAGRLPVTIDQQK